MRSRKKAGGVYDPRCGGGYPLAAHWGLYTPAVLRWSVTLTGVALAAFWVGLKTQDRVRQETFTRLLRFLLAGMALFFVYRGLFVGTPSH